MLSLLLFRDSFFGNANDGRRRQQTNGIDSNTIFASASAFFRFSAAAKTEKFLSVCFAALFCFCFSVIFTMFGVKDLRQGQCSSIFVAQVVTLLLPSSREAHVVCMRVAFWACWQHFSPPPKNPSSGMERRLPYRDMKGILF